MTTDNTQTPAGPPVRSEALLALPCLPCPFCGDFAAVFTWHDLTPSQTAAAEYAVGCGTLNCRGNASMIGWLPSDVPAEVAKWNRRAND